MAEVTPTPPLSPGENAGEDEQVRRIMRDTGVDEVEARFMLKVAKTGQGDVQNKTPPPDRASDK
jgi:hypothetical protein